MPSPVDQRAEPRSHGVAGTAVAALFDTADAAARRIGAGRVESLVVPVARGWLVAVRRGEATAAETATSRDEATVLRYALARRLADGGGGA